MTVTPDPICVLCGRAILPGHYTGFDTLRADGLADRHGRCDEPWRPGRRQPTYDPDPTGALLDAQATGGY